MMRPGAPGLAWRDSDFVLVSIALLLGVIATVTASFGASGAGSLAQQNAWFHVAVAGFAISGIGLSMWLLRGRRAVGDRRVALISLGDPDPEVPRASRTGRGAALGATEPLGLVRAAGMARVHHRDCPLVAGKPTEPAHLGDGDHCGVCGA